MSSRTIKLLGVVFVIMLGLVTSEYWLPYLKVGNLGRSDQTEHLADNTDHIQTITITDQATGDTSTLSNQSGTWSVNDLPASSARVSAFLDSLSSDSIDSLVSNNPDNHSLYDVGDQAGWHLTLQYPDHQAAVIIGSPTIQPNSYHARLGDQPEVYLVKGPLRDRLSAHVDFWRDRMVFASPADSISSIEINSLEGSTVLTRGQDGSWQAARFSDTRAIGEIMAESLESSLNPLEATGFVPPEDSSGFSDLTPKYSLTLTSTDPQQPPVTLTLAESTDQGWWVQVGDQAELLILDSSDVEAILINPLAIFE